MRVTGYLVSEIQSISRKYLFAESATICDFLQLSGTKEELDWIWALIDSL